MPLASTRGAASAKAFGWTVKKGSAGFAFMGQQAENSANVYGGSTVANMTLLSTQPASITLKAVGLAVDGGFIAQAGNQYSTNGGASWAYWAVPYSYTPTSMPPGVNGGIAYNPTAKRAWCYGTEYYPKGNYFYARINGITPTGSSNSYEGPNFSTSTGGYNVLYSPALDVFYIANYGGSRASWYYANGTTGTAGGATSGGSPGNMIAGISHNGYPIQASYAGFGSTYYLREYTTADLSSYTQYGTFDAGNGYAIHSPFFWAPVNNKYIKAAAPNTGSTIFIYTATSASPQSWTNVAGFSPSGAVGFVKMNFIEQSNGTLWLFGQYRADAGKGQSYTTNFTYYSTDGGTTWTNSSGNKYIALAKNFTP